MRKDPLQHGHQFFADKEPELTEQLSTPIELSESTPEMTSPLLSPSTRTGPKRLTGSAHPAGSLVLLALFPIVLVGCTKEKIKQAYETAKTQTQSIVQQTQEAVEEQLPETGRLRLEMTPAVNPIEKLNLELIQVGTRRVLQISSYDLTKEFREYPAVLFHGTTDVQKANELVGKTVHCDLYYQTAFSSPIAMTRPNGSIMVTFDAMNVEDNALTATLGTAILDSSDGSPARVGGGKLTAVVQGEDLDAEPGE